MSTLRKDHNSLASSQRVERTQADPQSWSRASKINAAVQVRKVHAAHGKAARPSLLVRCQRAAISGAFRTICGSESVQDQHRINYLGVDGDSSGVHKRVRFPLALPIFQQLSAHALPTRCQNLRREFSA
jgi:hypothetical protein